MKTAIRFVLVAAAMASLHHAADASQSLILANGLTGSVSLPNAAPFRFSDQRNQSFRFQFRVHNWSPGGGAYGSRTLWSTAGASFWCAIDADSSLHCTDWWDTLDDGNATVSVAGRNDFVVTVQRDMSAMLFYVQVCNVDLTGCGTSLQRKITAAGNGSSGGGGLSPFTFGSDATSAQLAYFRWQSGAAPFVQPRSTDAAADLMDFEFEGNGRDSGARALSQMSFSGRARFAASPEYPPGCNAGAQQTFRAGQPATLDGTGSIALNGGTSLSYLWQQLSGPANATWTDRKVAQPSISLPVFGSYVFQLTVADSSGTSSVCTVNHGAVATDDNFVVVTGSQQFDHFIGPAIMWGKNPWPWYDRMASQTGQLFVEKQKSDFLPVWRTASAHGTVSVARSFTPGVSIAGAGTSFAADFFGGSCPGAWNGNYLILWYPTQWGTRGYRYLTPTGCTDDEHMSVREPTYFMASAVSGGQYGVMSTSQIARWINGSNNANYYDNVLGFYALWKTTGLDYWHQAATSLADLWWESPGIDQGQTCWNGGRPGAGLEGYWCPAPRQFSLFGLMLRAVDQKPDMWQHGLYMMLDSHVARVSPAGPVGDIREDSAMMGQVCAGALLLRELNLDRTRATTYANFCGAMVHSHFGPYRRANGEFSGPQYPYSTWNTGMGTLTVTAGSKTATVDSGTIDCTNVTPAVTRLWVTASAYSNLNSAGDAMSYQVDACTASRLTLHAPYAGRYAGAHRGWMLGLIGGEIVQPFIEGYMAGQLAVAADALQAAGNTADAATAKTWAAGIAQWLMDKMKGGYRPATGGLFYVRGGLANDAGCEPDPEHANNNGNACTGEYSDVQSSRFLGAETVRALSHAYLYARSDQQKAAVDDFFGKMWGGLGGPGADDSYLSGFFPQAESGKAKDFGFCCGMGGGAQWAAARLGGLAAEDRQIIRVPVKIDSVANAAKVQATVTEPSGAATSFVCAASPCEITVDRRQGNHLLRFDSLDGAGHVLSSGEPAVLAVPR